MKVKSAKVLELQAQLTSLVDDVHKSDKGNKAAGVRVRKGLLDIIKAAKELRVQILAEAKASTDAAATAPATTEEGSK